ncbi:MAG: hypothetical protein AAB407_01940 [Patescibacteria group bacterium]
MNNRKGITLINIIFVVIGILIIGGGGYYVLGERTVSPLDTPQNSVPDDWKTYSNPKYSIEFKYPLIATATDIMEKEPLGNYESSFVQFVQLGIMSSTGLSSQENCNLDPSYPSFVPCPPEEEDILRMGFVSADELQKEIKILTEYSEPNGGIQAFMPVKIAGKESSVFGFALPGAGIAYIKYFLFVTPERGFIITRFLGTRSTNASEKMDVLVQDIFETFKFSET